MILIRQISWLQAARRDFEDFPDEVQKDAAQALSIAARGGKADTAKPFKGVDGGVFEIALRHRGEAFRVLSCSCGSARRFGSFTHSRSRL